MQRICKVLLPLSIFLLRSLPSEANDGYAAIAAGGIEFRKSANISMESEHLTISPNRVVVRYKFKNYSDKPETATLAFPMPPVTCGHWGSNTKISDFVVRVNGENVQPRKQKKAFAIKSVDRVGRSSPLNSDITTQVMKAGLPVDCIEVYNNKDLFRKAQKLGLAEDFHGQDPENVKFQTEVTYYWTQEFPAGRTMLIEHEYKPILGASTSLDPHYHPLRSLHWNHDVGLKEVKIWKDVTGIQSAVGYNRFVEYILLTANTWKGPIKYFQLDVEGESDDKYIGSTLGPLTNTSSNTARFITENFKPSRNLTVVFGSESQ